MIEGLKRSRELVGGHGWQVFGVVIVAFLIVFVVNIIFGVIAGAAGNDVVARIIATVIASTITAPISALVGAVLYFSPARNRSRARRGPGDGRGRRTGRREGAWGLRAPASASASRERSAEPIRIEGGPGRPVALPQAPGLRPQARAPSGISLRHRLTRPQWQAPDPESAVAPSGARTRRQS